MPNHLLIRNIKAAMQLRGICAHRLAILTKRHDSTIAAMLSRPTNPRADLLFAVADALHVNVDELRQKDFLLGYHPKRRRRA